MGAGGDTTATRPPSSCSKTNMHKLRDSRACMLAYFFFCHLIHSFSICLIYSAWSLEDQGTTGLKRLCSNDLTAFLALRFYPPILLNHFLSCH